MYQRNIIYRGKILTNAVLQNKSFLIDVDCINNGQEELPQPDLTEKILLQSEDNQGPLKENQEQTDSKQLIIQQESCSIENSIGPAKSEESKSNFAIKKQLKQSLIEDGMF